MQGLGGPACGPMCTELMAVGLKSALNNASDTEVTYGHPRVEVCPALCHNSLGVPLCSCPALAVAEHNAVDVEWSEVCASFCMANYALRGCAPCDSNTMVPTYSSLRALDTADGWVAWCNVQCRQGQGGAACNCDRAPL